jgi:DNA polymerase-3 subunit alpha
MKLTIQRTRRIRIVRKDSEYWSAHTHSRYSAGDALPSVEDLVRRAKELRYPALGLTDHGNMAGSIQLYQECQKAGIKPFPGTEIYLVHDRSNLKAKRYHACVLAYSNEGYKNLVRLNTRAHRQFHYKPILDLADLAEMSEAGETGGLAFLTGCYFGMVVQTLINDGQDVAKALVASFAQWFPGSTYVELQAHRIDQEPMSEADIQHGLICIATDLGLPVVLTQDSHYTHQEDKDHHESLKRLVSWSPDADEAVFPGDGFHMADEAWMRAHHDTFLDYEAGIAGLKHLLDKHTLTIPQLDAYEYRVPFTSAEPQHDLAQRCVNRMFEMGLDKPRYLERLNDELAVVEISRMAGYLMLVSEVTDHCREQEIFFQCRGSAAGSLICYLLGITNVDPLKWNLMMERFLSKDRTKPPDIDLDIESTRRLELLDWLSTRFATMQIGNWLTYSMAGGEDGKGSLRVRLFSSLRKQGVDEPKWENVDAPTRKELHLLSDMGLISGPGVHAAGVLLTSTKTELEDLVPEMYIASSETFVSQYDMHDVEKLGLVKLDVLGLKTMSVLRQTILNLGLEPKDGLDFIPTNDTKTFTMLAKGDTAGVFQLEGGTAARGMRELRPTTIKDVIASMALYRPATMQSGATESYVERKHGKARPVRHPIIEAHTKDTQGILLYQEQVIAVLRDLGLDPDDLTAFLKAVKASNGNIGDAAGVIKVMLVDIKERCAAAGMDGRDVEWLERALEAYAGYGFNAAHATVYGLTAYRCAWLARNHPVEFHAALLAVAAGSPKEPMYVRATKHRGVRVLRADVNRSGISYQMDPGGKAVRRGLLAIKGIGIKAAEAITTAQPFTDLADFTSRVNPRQVTGIKDMAKTGITETMIGTVAKLYDAGALNSLLEEQT